MGLGTLIVPFVGEKDHSSDKGILGPYGTALPVVKDSWASPLFFNFGSVDIRIEPQSSTLKKNALPVVKEIFGVQLRYLGAEPTIF